jgi:cytochrome b pre-mRNA-processing protein 6
MAANGAAANLAKHYARILKQWPQDLLRPTSTFSSVIEKRAAAVKSTMTAQQEKAEMRNVNALYSLLDGRYSKKVCQDQWK